MLVLARWVHFVAMVAVFGGALFPLYMGSRRRIGAVTGLESTVRATARIIRVAAPCAAMSGIAWLGATIANMTGDFADVADRETLHAFFFETSFGPLAVARLILLAVLVSIAFAPMRAYPRFVALVAISAPLLISQAWLGHAAEGGETLYGASMIVSYAVHVLAGAAWVGGLPPLLLAILEQEGRIDPRSATLSLLSRYSEMAVVAASLIIVSGLANTAFRVGGAFGALVATGYGDVLLAKTALVAVMLGLAAFNRFVMMPRLKKTDPEGTGWLRASIVLECTIGVFVLGAAAVLGITPPPR